MYSSAMITHDGSSGQNVDPSEILIGARRKKGKLEVAPGEPPADRGSSQNEGSPKAIARCLACGTCLQISDFAVPFANLFRHLHQGNTTLSEHMKELHAVVLKVKLARQFE